MIILNTIEYILVILSIVFLFINWQISIILFVTGSIVHVIPSGPNKLLSVIAGYLVIFGVVYMFKDWVIGLFLIFGAFSVTRLRAFGNKIYNRNHL